MNVDTIPPTTWAQIRACWQALEDKKAEDLKLLYVGPRSSVTDFFLIATGTSQPHLKALSASLSDALKQVGLRATGRDTAHDSGWTVIDAFDFVVHVFLKEVRGRYQLEALWKDAVIVTPEVLASAGLKPVASTPAKAARRKAPSTKAPVDSAKPARTSRKVGTVGRKPSTEKAAGQAKPAKRSVAKKAPVKKGSVRKAPAKKAAAARKRTGSSEG